MAGAFDAKVVISTAEAIAGLQAIRDEVKLLGPELVALDKIIKDGKQNIVLIAQQFTNLVAQQERAAKAAGTMAKADIDAARAAGIRSVADSKTEENLARKAMLEAQATAATERANLSAERGFSVSQKRVQGDVDRAAAAEKAAAATEKAAAAEGGMQASMANSRYLMYDVAATYGMLSAALLAIPAATAAVAASYEKDFAQVLRISDQTTAQAASLQQGLKNLGDSIPMSFKDMTDIAQMGAHLQLGNEGLVQFTETVAKFSVTTGVAADTAASMFSKMKTMFAADAASAGPGYFNDLGSSIAEMGTKIVATDQQVTSMVTSIQAATASAGLSTEATVGLSGAMASLSIAPEMARGALTRLFANFNRDSTDAAGKMQKFGDVIGKSGTEAAALWKSDPNKFFTELIASLNKTYTAGGDLTTIFDTLGIKNVRDVATLQRLAVGYDVLNKSQTAATDGYAKGTALDRLSKPVFETLVSKLTELTNAWKNLGDTLGAGILAPIGAFATILKDVAMGMDALIHQFPLVGTGLQILLGIGTVVGMFLALKGASALAMAAMLGFKEAALKGMGSTMELGSMLKTLAQIMLITKGATEEQSIALLGQVSATKQLMIATSTSKTAIAGMTLENGVASAAANGMMSSAKGMGSALLSLAGGPIGIAVGAVALLSASFITSGQKAEEAGKAIAAGMAEGADAGIKAAAQKLGEAQVAWTDAIAFGNLNKNVTQVAQEVGLPFDKLVLAATKGKDAIASITPELDKLAKSKGFNNWDAWNSSNTKGAGQVRFLTDKLKEYADQSVTATNTTDAVNGAVKKAGAAFGDMPDPVEQSATALDTMTKALKGLNDEVFGTLNASSDLQGALVKIGEGLQKGNSFNVMNESGRNNIKNVEDALTKARDYYSDLMTKQKLTAQQAAQGYSDFTTGLLNDIKNKFGGNTAAIDKMAQDTTNKFRTAIGGAPVSVPVTTDKPQVQAVAQDTSNYVDAYLKSRHSNVNIGADTSGASNKMMELAVSIAKITGYPVTVVMDALTNPASDKAKEIHALIKSITDHTYVAPIGADTSAAETNVRNFADYAKKQLASIQAAYNQVASRAPVFASHVKSMFPGVQGVTNSAPAGIALPQSNASVATIAAPAQVQAMPAPDPALAPALTNITNGYNSAADAAQKAGGAAKGAAAASKEAAKDYASGISEAVQQATDYGNRLKTALMSAYTQQYGLTTATDDYHSALNAITKKHADELTQLEDLRIKQRALNDERDKELISASKAKTEQNISVKYGEVGRAADYGNQAQTALDNAAAKQKEIDANTKESKTLADGIGNLTGYSDAAIANRAALRGLESKMIDMIAAYASAGHTTEEVRAYSQQLTGQYKLDVTQMGYNQTAVNDLQGSLGRYIDTVDRVPRIVPTTVTADTTDAQNKFNDLNNAKDALEQPVDIPVTVDTTGFEANFARAMARVEANYQKTLADPVGTGSGIGGTANGSLGGHFASGGLVRGFADGGLVPGHAPSNPSADNLMAKVDGKGLIGIRSQEFIQPEPAVKHYGLDAMEAIRTLRMPKFNMGGSPGGARGGSGSAGSSIVGLDAETLAVLASFQKDVKLYVDSRELASSVNAGNKQLAAEGSH